MDIPVQISFRNMDASDAVAAKAREKAEKLETYFSRITSCRVMIEAPHRHNHKGKLYRVRIDLGVPGRPDIVVNQTQSDKHAHEDVYVAMRDAFEAAKRQLEDHARKLRPDDKANRVA